MSMPSSPLSSDLSTPQPAITKEVDEEMEEEPEEEEQEDEVEDNEEDDEMEVDENVQIGSITENEPLAQSSSSNKQDATMTHNLLHPPPQRQQRVRKVYPQKTIGTTILPVTRVTRAAKQDKDIKIISKEAVFLISIATEFFVKKLTNSAFERSRREKRVFVKYNDVATAVKQNPEYDWLEEVIPISLPLGTILRDPLIPSSSTALTNKLPTEALTDNTSIGQSTLPTDNLIFHQESNLNAPLPSTLDVIEDLVDQDELDEDI